MEVSSPMDVLVEQKIEKLLEKFPIFSLWAKKGGPKINLLHASHGFLLRQTQPALPLILSRKGFDAWLRIAENGKEVHGVKNVFSKAMVLSKGEEES
ncbi:MAG: hypothetical protein EHM36_00275 [Deltaproteobacteria bacterium]|nr:MAG: hypothetical protein EHM36_00275 [Deltaproteobacteria bacterium]